MFRSLSPRSSSIRLFLFFLLAAGLLSACSGGGSSQPAVFSAGSQPATPPPGTGGLAFRLVWEQPGMHGKVMRTPAFNACIDHSIGTMAATVSAGTTTIVTASFTCAAHQGQILGVPAGQNFTVRVNGLSTGATPTTTWTGSVFPVTVSTGQITNAGTIVMTFVGTDTTRPTVQSIVSRSSSTNTTSVPITDRFNIAFNKAMAISTVTSTNITLTDTGTSLAVPGIVSLVTASTSTASFIPSANLTPGTTYALRVVSCFTPTICITDTNGNTLATNYSNTFTTEPAAVAMAAVPTGLTATPGNAQVTLDWPAVGGAASYNVYYSTTSPVTILTGTQVQGLQAPAVHLARTNGQATFYIVTSVNGFGESAASTQASATPVFPGGNPLPPASLTLTASTGQNVMTWPTVAGATSYNLYWQTRPIGPDKYSADNVFRDVTSPFTHTGLTTGLNYCYIVSALNANGESADSMQVCGGLGSIIITW